MLNIRLPAEIRAYKSKLIAGFSVRQILSLVAAMVICVPVGVFGHGHAQPSGMALAARQERECSLHSVSETVITIDPEKE